MVSVIERLDAFLSLALAHLRGVGHFEESRRQLDEPFGVYDGDLAHILFCRHNKLVVDDPVRLSLKKSTARVDIHWLILDECSVTLLRVLSSSMEEESGSDCLPDLCKILACSYNIQFVPEMEKECQS